MSLRAKTLLATLFLRVPTRVGVFQKEQTDETRGRLVAELGSDIAEHRRMQDVAVFYCTDRDGLWLHSRWFRVRSRARMAPEKRRNGAMTAAGTKTPTFQLWDSIAYSQILSSAVLRQEEVE